jgi:hypothetical protein
MHHVERPTSELDQQDLVNGLMSIYADRGGDRLISHSSDEPKAETYKPLSPFNIGTRLLIGVDIEADRRTD